MSLKNKVAVTFVLLLLGYFSYIYLTGENNTESNLTDTTEQSSDPSLIEEKESNTITKYNFEQIGYFKGSNNNRVFTFEIKTNEGISMNEIPVDLWESMRNHGLSRMNTSGRNTQVFYYLSDVNIPDVTLSNNFDEAINKAYEVKPLALVYVQFDGQSGLTEYPE